MAYRILLFLLLTIPISFKIDITSNIRFLIQEPFIIFFVAACNFNLRTIKTYSYPFLFFIASILIIIFSSILSLFLYFDPVGLFKAIKYFIYASAIFTLFNNPSYLNKELIDKVLKYGFICIIFSLSLYIINFLILDFSWAKYVSYSTWKSKYMPTGMSNLSFDIKTFSFVRTGGNHGIYGSYLVLLLILALNKFFKSKYKKCKLLIILILVNLSFVTAREAILLLLLIILFYSLHHFITRSWVNKKAILFSSIAIISFILIFIIWSPKVVILHKINHMLKAISETGGLDKSANYRFNTWYLFFTFLASNPWHIILGIGFNRTRLGEILEFQERALGKELFHVDLPESIYVASLGYGGIFSFIFLILFFITLFYLLYNSGKLSRIFSFFLLGLMVTNATGASLYAELFLSQFGIVCAVLIYKGKEIDEYIFR